ncbi:MAG: family transcriptional regulator [Chthonomonadaceae bacterium]|nr:family transcriptional regulator [Chthonomonadaceae bacterium]
MVNTRSLIQPVLLSRINEQQILRMLLEQGALSRAEIARVAGIGPPTVSRAVEALLQSGLIEEDAPQAAFGRPAKRLRLAVRSSQVLGLVLDAERCRIVCSGLDGKVRADLTQTFTTPDTYEELLERAETALHGLISTPGMTTLGIGISMPGLVDTSLQQGLLSPNLPITNGRAPGRDLEERLGVECLVMQEEHALCLAERYFGNARGLENFAMLDVSTGVGLGVMSGGRLLTGQNGLAGEIGHITVDIGGRRCGCGNGGCLETVACDTALAAIVSQRLGRKVDFEEMAALVESGQLTLGAELDTLCAYLAVALAAVINLFNPSSLFVHGRLFGLDPGLFPRLLEETKPRALAPSFQACRIVQARGSKRQGAIAAIIDHLIDAIVPMEISNPTYGAFA